MCSLSADMSWLSWRSRIRRKLPPRRQHPCDNINGYPVFRGWCWDRTQEVVSRFNPDLLVIQSIHPDKLLETFSQFCLPMFLYIREVEDIQHLAAVKKFDLRVLANSPFTAERLKVACGLDSTVAPPLVEPSFYKTPSTRQRVLFINTVPRKGLDTALALARARQDIEFDFVLSWIIRGEKLTEFRARIAEYRNIALHANKGHAQALF